MNISKRQTSGKTLALYTEIFFVLFFLLQIGCVKLSVSCNIKEIDIKNKKTAIEECTKRPNVTVIKEF